MLVFLYIHHDIYGDELDVTPRGCFTHPCQIRVLRAKSLIQSLLKFLSLGVLTKALCQKLSSLNLGGPLLENTHPWHTKIS